jgi:hypothetical protein
MPTMTETVRRFAEEPEAAISEPAPPEGRVLDPSFCLSLSASPTQSTVTRVRTSEARLDETIGDIRTILRQRGYSRVAWCIGPSCQPEGLTTLLAARGFFPATRAPFEPEAHALALVQAPPRHPDDVEARLVRDYDEYLQALLIAMEAFGVSSDDAAGWMTAAPALWKQQDGVNRMTLIALFKGRPVGFAFAARGPHGLMMCGSGVLASERGHGAYRALVSARWKVAVELGKPALVIHAGAMSRPIVERCGFEPVCRIEIVEDPLVPTVTGG